MYKEKTKYERNIITNDISLQRKESLKTFITGLSTQCAFIVLFGRKNYLDHLFVESHFHENK